MNASAEDALAALPGALPGGESVLWAARPAAGDLLRHLFHLRALLVLTSLLAAWPVLAGLDAGLPPAAALPGALLFLPFALPVLGLAWLLARTIARSTLYVVTDRRVILQVGYVYVRTVNIPLRLIRGVAVRPHRGGLGDVQIDVEPGALLGYPVLAPHARLLHLRRPVPLMRAVPDAERAAEALVMALMQAGVPLRRALAPSAAPEAVGQAA